MSLFSPHSPSLSLLRRITLDSGKKHHTLHESASLKLLTSFEGDLPEYGASLFNLHHVSEQTGAGGALYEDGSARFNILSKFLALVRLESSPMQKPLLLALAEVKMAFDPQSASHGYVSEFVRELNPTSFRVISTFLGDFGAEVNPETCAVALRAREVARPSGALKILPLP